MRVSKIITITAIIAVAASTNQLQASNDKEAREGYFAIPWSIPDWLVGLSIGVYGSLNARARDGDCFSKWYDWGFAAAELSNYFTKPFDTRNWQVWAGLVIKTGTMASGTYFTWNRCIKDLADAKDTKWSDNYGFLSEDIEVSPRV